MLYDKGDGLFNCNCVPNQLLFFFSKSVAFELVKKEFILAGPDLIR